MQFVSPAALLFFRCRCSCPTTAVFSATSCHAFTIFVQILLRVQHLKNTVQLHLEPHGTTWTNTFILLLNTLIRQGRLFLSVSKRLFGRIMKKSFCCTDSNKKAFILYFTLSEFVQLPLFCVKMLQSVYLDL